MQMSDRAADHTLSIKEQVFDDQHLRATLRFSCVNGSSEPYRIVIAFWDTDKSREYRFDATGVRSGSGVKVIESDHQSKSNLRLVR